METLETIEGYFKARCSYLVCQHSSIQPILISKTEYANMCRKFEAAIQREINFSLNTCENSEMDLIKLLNRLLEISDKSRSVFVEINDPYKLHRSIHAETLKSIHI